MIGSAIFGEDNDVYLIVSVILVSGASYFRFTGREIKVVKKKTKTVKDKKSIKDKLKDDIRHVHIADATGIPVVNDMSLGVSSELNVDHFYASGLGDRGS